MLKGPKVSILLEPSALGDCKLSLFHDDKIVDVQNYASSTKASPIDQLHYMLSDLLSLLAPDMKDTDEEVLYIVKCPGLDHKNSKKRNFTFSGSTKH